MIISGPKTLAAAMCALLLMGSGCDLLHRKKLQPPPSIPPSIEKQPKIDLPNPQPTPPPTPEPTPEATPTPPTPKPKPKHNSRPKKTVVQPEPENTSPTPEPAKPSPDASINAPMSNADAERQKQRTSNLLGSAENNLANIHRALNVDEQNMVSQIRNYITQSRKAMTDGDLERAYNLANKANLLSTELVKE
ncbi:MAG TPA: hypothetical protein VGL89_01525 [Candidatus Koribacter sp.]|jgi:outer membrane biosynthesis protein TonB